MAGVGMKLTVKGYRQMLTELRRIEPDLTKEMRREVRAIAAPLRKAIKSGIPKDAPLSHMRPKVSYGDSVGRLRWGAGRPANYTSLDLKKPARKKKEGTSLARILVTSPATVMADMAGRSGKYIGARPYAKGTKANSYEIMRGKYKGQMGYGYRYAGSTQTEGRMHRNTGGQGRGMIRNLGKHGSRYVYPAIEGALPGARVEVLKIVSKYAAVVNRRTR